MDLQELVGKLFDEKMKEQVAKDERIRTELAIAAMIETKANGSRTVDAGNGVKVTVKRANGYKAEIEAIRDLDIPDEVKPLKLTDPVPALYVFDQKAYENIIENHPDVAAKIAPLVAVVPRKVSVTLKLG